MIYLLGYVVLLSACIGWTVWRVLPARVQLSDGHIVKRERGRRESMPVAQLECIRFHYHAVVGFIGSWEFVSNDGQVLHVGSEARGIDETIDSLEDHLAGFSVAEFKRRFAAGDVEDSIDVWQRDNYAAGRIHSADEGGAGTRV